jgi:hypothetical protein
MLIFIGHLVNLWVQSYEKREKDKTNVFNFSAIIKPLCLLESQGFIKRVLFCKRMQNNHKGDSSLCSLFFIVGLK